MITDYIKAMKLGEKEYKLRVSRGEYPYLPVLDEIVSHVEIESQVPLGLVQIPLKQIVGTYSALLLRQISCLYSVRIQSLR